MGSIAGISMGEWIAASGLSPLSRSIMVFEVLRMTGDRIQVRVEGGVSPVS